MNLTDERSNFLYLSQNLHKRHTKSESALYILAFCIKFVALCF